MLEAGVLDKVFLALSREPGFKKVHVYYICILFYRPKIRKYFIKKLEYIILLKDYTQQMHTEYV